MYSEKHPPVSPITHMCVNVSVYVYVYVYIYSYIYIYISVYTFTYTVFREISSTIPYGVTTMSRLLKIIGLFRRI